LAKTGMMVDSAPAIGQEDDVDVGMAEQPEQVLPEQRIAAPLRVEKNGRPKARSVSSRIEPRISGGKATNHHQRGDQHVPAEIGIESSACPAARIFRIETTISTASVSAEDLDERHPSQPDVGVDARRCRRSKLSGVVHEPAAVGRATPKTSDRVMIVPPNR